jgi:Protein of unknown function (DUF3224)
VITIGTLNIERWDEVRNDALESGGRLVHVRITEAFDGGIVGSSVWDDLLYYRADGTASFVILGQIIGQVDGKPGSFVVSSSGAFDGETASSSWVIVPDSGTEALRGISGTGKMETRPPHPGSYTLDYTLPG